MHFPWKKTGKEMKDWERGTSDYIPFKEIQEEEFLKNRW